MEGIVIDRVDISALFDALTASGYRIIGPSIRDGVIALTELESFDDLPVGWTDVQEAGNYHIERRSDDAMFGYVVGPQSPKSYLFPPRSVLVEVDRVDGSLAFTQPDRETRPFAFVGIRPCELAAVSIQDTVFMESGVVDATYATARSGMFTVGVNCGVAGGTCFCVSMGTGPRCTEGYDIALTEVIDGDDHRFVLEGGSEAGDQILRGLPGRPAESADFDIVEQIVAATSRSMGRTMATDGIKELLYGARSHPQWEEIASRCLACTNCTLVCPTCFCHTAEDTASLDGREAKRSRRWDSCFTLDFSNLHGAPVRTSVAGRYRQWMTHKLASWQDQFGSSGCVGCGRCITWCPVGIDITAEVAALRGGS